MDVKLGPWRPREYEPNSKVGWNQRRQVSGQGHDPDAMDIDTTEIDVNAAQAGKPVTCYYCNNEGHMKKDCHTFKAAQQKGEDESLGAETTATTFENNKARGEARRTSPDLDSLMVHINRLRIEDHWDFMECLFGLETSDHAKETTYIRATKVHMMYARKTKAIHADFKLLTMQRVTEECTLLDSGASENLMNKGTWKTLGTRTFMLPKPITIYNIDGTENKQGKVTQYCWLKIRKGNEEQRMKFFIANTGEDCFVLGHPFLSAFNPQVNWSRGQILGPTIDILMVKYKQAQKLLRKTQLRAL